MQMKAEEELLAGCRMLHEDKDVIFRVVGASV
jgi:hypothetical protein